MIQPHSLYVWSTTLMCYGITVAIQIGPVCVFMSHVLTEVVTICDAICVYFTGFGSGCWSFKTKVSPRALLKPVRTHM